ncbi:MAG: metal ABC transporter substrate-binding protein [Peptococcaceae bacterium]|jgi:zinc transport system substrate-binding protein|nr:metal ABC transporter substrate-binding protein [Peptococcaceae bacterium]
MKRLSALALAALLILLILTLAACARIPADSQSDVLNPDANDKISVIATTFAPYDFTREITGGKAEVAMLLPPASESHSFEPSPQDIVNIQNCDVFIYVGGDSDAWVDEVLESMDTSKMKLITLMDCVDVVEEEIIPGMEAEEEPEEDEGDAKPEYDEHVWTSPRNARLIVQKIANTLCEVDSLNAAVYTQNLIDYSEKLAELDGKFQEVVASAVRKTLVFGDRFPFRYFVDAYGLNYAAAFPGCSTETEPSAKTVKFLIDKINDEQIPVIFHIELSNQKMANTIAEATGAKVRLLHACHNVSRDDFKNGESYLSLMTRNVETLKEALQ